MNIIQVFCYITCIFNTHFQSAKLLYHKFSTGLCFELWEKSDHSIQSELMLTNRFQMDLYLLLCPYSDKSLVRKCVWLGTLAILTPIETLCRAMKYMQAPAKQYNNPLKVKQQNPIIHLFFSVFHTVSQLEKIPQLTCSGVTRGGFVGIRV